MRRFFSILSILFCITFVAADDEMVDSAIFKSWNRYGVDTSVTRNTKMNIGGKLYTAKQTSKLIVKTESAVSLDDITVMDVDGKEQTQKSERFVSAKVKKGKEEMPEAFEGEMKNIRNDWIKIEGKEYECRVLEFTGKTPQGPATGKFWMHDDVPGLVVKAQIKTSSKQGDVDLEIMLATFELK